MAASACLIHTASAIDPDRAMSQYVHDSWGGEQGFPKGPVYAIAQTRDGYLWIGTEAGLVRFDGWSFRLVKDDSGAFTIGSVLGLTSDDDGCLWVRLQDLSLVRYCQGVFRRPSPHDEVYTRIEAMGRTSRGQLLAWKAEDGAFRFHGNNFDRLASANDLPPSPVISLAQTSDGDVWMGTRDAGLFRDTRGTTRAIRDGLPDLKVNCLLPEGAQALWVGTDKGIVSWNGQKITGAGIPPSLGSFQALGMVRDRDGNVWVGTDSRGLLRLNSRAVGQLDIGEAITALFEDREGDLWIGHADGIERLRDSAFVTYSVPEGLPTGGSNPVFVDAAGRLWFPPVAGGLWWVKDGRHGRVTGGGLERDVVYSLAGRKGELWIGRKAGGLSRLADRGDSFDLKSYTHADGLAQDSVYSVYPARDGSVWAGTLSAGVSVLRDGRFTNYTIADGLAANTVASILEGAGGTMWFATPSGLSTLSDGRWRTYGTADGLPSDNVNCLLEDSSGVLWAGTASGIAFLSGQRFEIPPAGPAPLRAQILGIAEDRYGSLWVATSNSVMRVSREKLFRGTVADGDVREYGLADGLRDMEGVKRHRSVIADPEGRIWISLTRGISVVDPARLKRNSAPAIAHVQTISADGVSVPLGAAIQIPAGSRRVTFGYAGLSLSMPERVRYRYRLDGFDRGWSEPVDGREAVYTNLAPGSYRFHLIASNPDGGWSGDDATTVFQVEPLFWQTGWFVLGVVTLCAAGILAIYRFRLRLLTQRLNLRFQERLAERTRIAQELHDTLLQGFLSASMQIHVATDSLPEDSGARAKLTRALELMRQVIDEGRNAVRGLRSSPSASLDLERAFSAVQQELALQQQDSRKVNFRVIVEGEQRPLHPMLRDELYRIGREALINAFRHAQAKTIEMELKYSSRRLSLLVRDDGRGIDPGVLQAGREGHWGLSGMRERADRIGAELHVMSRASAGTEIELSVPGNVAFQNQKTGWLGRHFHRTNGDQKRGG